VVAFSQAPGLFPRERYRIREVLYRIWWTSGAERGVLSLNVPGRLGAIAQLPVASCDLPPDHPAREGEMALTTARMPVGLDFTGEELEQLYLTLDVSASQVHVRSGPTRVSMVVLNPPSEDELKGRDADGDGVDDLEELGNPHRDPFRADPAEASESAPVKLSLRPARKPAGKLPQAKQRLENLQVSGKTHFTGEVIHHTGTLVVTGDLTLNRTTLLLAPAKVGPAPPPTGRPNAMGNHVDLTRYARILVQDSGRLHIKGGSTVAATTAENGFSIHAGRGAQLILENSRFVHPGVMMITGGNRAIRLDGVMVRSPGARIRGNTFLHGFRAISAGAPGIILRDNTFVQNAVDIEVLDGSVEIRGNRSYGSGSFVQIKQGIEQALVKGNQLDWCVEPCISISPGTTGVDIIGNKISRSMTPMAFKEAEGIRVQGNKVVRGR